MTGAKTTEPGGVDASNTERDSGPNCVSGTNEPVSEGVTKLGELKARVGEELTRIGSGGPWVWCVILFWINNCIFN